MDAGLGGGIAHDTDGLAGALTGTSIRLGPLAAHRQAAQVAHATVALDALQALEVHADFAAKITFDDVLAVLDRVHDLRELLLRQIFGPDFRIDIGLIEDLDGVAWADAIDIPQSDIDALIRRNFYTNDTCHVKSGLVD